MAKLSGQLTQEGVPYRLTRTERRIESRERQIEIQKRKAEIEDAQQKLSTAKSLEEYEQIYSSLNSFQQSGVASPNEIRQRLNEQRQSTITQVQQRLTKLSEDKTKARQKYEQSIRDLQEDERWAKSRYSGDRLKEMLDDIRRRKREVNNEYDAKQEYYRGIEEGFREGLNKLNQGQFLSYSNITSYAGEKGSYYQQKVEARNEQKEASERAYQKLLQTDPYAPIFKEFQAKYKGRIDWTDPKTVLKIKEYGFAERSPQRFLAEKTEGLTAVEKKIPTGTITYFETPEGKRQSLIRVNETTGDLVFEEGGKGGLTVSFKTTPLKEIQEQAIEEKEKELATKPYYLPFETGGKRETGTISTVETENLTLKSSEVLEKEPSVFTKIWEKLPKDLPVVIDVEKYEALKEKRGRELSPAEVVFGGVVKFKKTAGEGEMGLTEALEKSVQRGQDKTQARIQEVEAGLSEKYGLSETAEKDIVPLQEAYQTAFERKYYAPLVRGEITFEEAEKEFGKSEIGKLIQQDIQDTYTESYKEARAKIPAYEKTVTGSRLVGLNLKMLGYELIPTTSRALVGEVILTATSLKAVKLYRALPTAVRTGVGVTVTTGITAQSIYGLRPTAQPEEFAGGVLTLGLVGVSAGRGVYRWLRTPVIKTVKIPAPTLSAIEEETLVSKPVAKFTAELGGVERELTLYKLGSQRQLLATGRLTTVTTKGRQLLSQFGVKLKPLYTGVPSESLGRLVKVSGLEYDFAFRTESGYQKALKRLMVYGVPEAQARQTLRYYAPIKRITTTTGKIKYVEGSVRPYLIEEVERRILQPVVAVEGGYKTRGALPKIEYIKGGAVAIGETKTGATIYKGGLNVERALLSPQGYPYTPLKWQGKTISQYEQTILAKATRQGEMAIGTRTPEVSIAKVYPYEEIASVSAYRKVVPRGARGVSAERVKALLGEAPVKISISEKDFYRQTYGLSTKEIPVAKEITKTYKPVDLYTKEDVKKLLKDLKTIYGQPEKIAPLKRTTEVSQGTAGETKLVTKYQAIRLKALNIPDSAPVRKVKEILKSLGKLEQAEAGATAQSSALASGVAGAVRTRLSQVEKEELRYRQTASPIEIERQIEKVIQAQAQGQGLVQTQKTLQLQLQQPRLTVPSLALKEPVIKTPTLTPPTITPFFFEFPTPKRARGKKRRGVRTAYGVAYQPDFTARALGIEPEVLSEKEAQKLVKRVLTGLEVRKGVVLR